MESAKKEKDEATWLRAKKDEDDRRLRLSSQCVFRHSKSRDRAFLRVVATIRENDYGFWVGASVSGRRLFWPRICSRNSVWCGRIRKTSRVDLEGVRGWA